MLDELLDLETCFDPVECAIPVAALFRRFGQDAVTAALASGDLRLCRPVCGRAVPAETRCYLTESGKRRALAGP